MPSRDRARRSQACLNTAERQGALEQRGEKPSLLGLSRVETEQGKSQMKVAIPTFSFSHMSRSQLVWIMPWWENEGRSPTTNGSEQSTWTFKNCLTELHALEVSFHHSRFPLRIENSNLIYSHEINEGSSLQEPQLSFCSSTVYKTRSLKCVKCVMQKFADNPPFSVFLQRNLIA